MLVCIVCDDFSVSWIECFNGKLGKSIYTVFDFCNASSWKVCSTGITLIKHKISTKQYLLLWLVQADTSVAVPWRVKDGINIIAKLYGVVIMKVYISCKICKAHS